MKAPLGELDFDKHWSESLDTYERHPTSRHRRRFVMNSLRRLRVSPDDFVYDYGCGPALLLDTIRSEFKLQNEDLGGCDLSKEAIRLAHERMPGGCFSQGSYPRLDRPINIAICTEVIEHTREYRDILAWIFQNMRRGGKLVLTTPGGTMDPPDQYYGHTQHFRTDKLRTDMETIGFSRIQARHWGAPLFSLQKWVTKRNFAAVQQSFMEGPLTTRRKLLFTVAYWAYFVHDLVPFGPQIFLTAEKPA